MADRAFPRRAFTQGEEVGSIFIDGQEAEFVFGKGTQLLPSLGAEIYGRTSVRMVSDDAGAWFEVGFRMDHLLSGNAATGFTDQGNYFRIELEQSFDLVNWAMGQFSPPPVPIVDNGDGTWTYWSRAAVPRLWKFVTIDLTLVANRHSKSITSLRLFGANVSLPNYPYVMPAAAATLQADLIAAGYAGALVSSVSKPMTVTVTNFVNDGTANMPVTLSGSDVTMVKTTTGANISRPGYPYAMPSQVTNLQAALVAAGYPYASARVYGDEWTIFIPDRSTTLNERRIQVIISPADPYTYQGMFGTGTDPGNIVSGTSGNVRATTGLAPLSEADKQFARLKITPGTRYDPFLP